MEQLILNLVPGGVSPVCYVSQYDVGRKIRLHLRNGSDPYVLSGAETVTATIRKVSGEELIYDIANTSASYVDMIVNYDATDVIGESVCELIITQSGIRLGSANFKMRIDPDVYSGDQKLEVVSATSETPDLSFETNVEENLLELKAGFSPVQDLHGYDSPWIDSNEVNKVPYIKRAVTGTATRIGNHLYDKLVGGTVAFNQMVQNGNFADSSNWTAVRITLSVSNNVGTLTQDGNSPYIEQRNNFIAGHKYLYNADLKANNSTIVLSAIYDNERTDKYYPVSDETWTNAAFIITPATTGTSNKERYRITLRTGDTAQVKNTYLIDLTAMFGSTIADYIYSLEQATAGAGVAWFKALFPNDYYAYNAGELMSVKATAHVMKNASNQVIGNYALDSDLVLNGLFKLDANNKLYADGDIYESSGLVTRKYEHRAYASGDESLPDTITDGTHTVTKLVTPTTETAEPFTNPQVCDENGTEEYTDNRAVAIPVGHETYQANICEITGFDELNIQQCGVNLWDEEWEVGAISIENGIAYGGNNQIRSKNFCPIVPGKNYYLYSSKTDGGSQNRYYIAVLFYDENKNYISYAYANRLTFTAPSGAKYFRITTNSSTVIYGQTYNNDISINYPATDTQYHTYSGKIIKLEFDDTVYLAEVSCLNGVWKLKLLGAEVDLGDLNWMYNANLKRFYARFDDGKASGTAVGLPALCDTYPVDDTNQYNNLPDGSISVGSNYISGTVCAIVVHDERYSSDGKFKTAMAGNKVICELATPIEITLDETEQFEALLGVNNIWHDANGGTEVKFFRIISAS